MTLPAEIFAEAISLKQVVFVCMTVGFLIVAVPMAIRFSWMDKVCIAGIMFMAINPVDVSVASSTALASPKSVNITRSTLRSSNMLAGFTSR